MTTARPSPVVLEIYGEGKTDVGTNEKQVEGPPRVGLVAIFTHGLCEKPPNCRLTLKRWSTIGTAPNSRKIKGTLKQKFLFATRNARINGSDGVIFVADSEGEDGSRQNELHEGRKQVSEKFPVAIGLPHPCIESWLLADPVAVGTVLRVSHPDLPDEPELIAKSAKCRSERRN